MHKVLIVIDKHGWSYDTIARGLVKHNPNADLVFDIVGVNEESEFIERHHGQYDLVFAIGWTLVMSKRHKHHYRDLLPFLDRDKLITGIHSHRSWDDYLSLPEADREPPGELVQRLSKLKGINIISRRLFRIFSEAGLSNIVLTENGVDATLFTPARPVNTDRRTPLVIGFSGSTEIAKHDHLKGFSEFILAHDIGGPSRRRPRRARGGVGRRRAEGRSGRPATAARKVTDVERHSSPSVVTVSNAGRMRSGRDFNQGRRL